MKDYVETQILGCFLKDNDLLKETILQPHHFTGANQRLYEAMMTLTHDGRAVDNVTLVAECYDLLQQLGGPDYIMSIETTGHTEKFESYEQTLLNQYKQSASEKVVKDWLSNDEKDTQELVSKVQQIDEEGVQDEQQITSILAEMYEEPYQPRTKNITGIPTDLTDLDKLTGGWQNGDSIIMGARPSMGKTATMLKIARGAIENGDVPIIFSLEMSTKSLLKRMAAAHSGINGFLARNPQNLSDIQKEQWSEAVGKMSTYDFEVWDKPMQTIQYIRGKVRQARKRYEGKRIIVLVDYLTLINNPGKWNSDHAKVSDISARLKAIAKEYDCPVITLAQLSRGVEQRPNKKPMLSDLRESGSIEQDADIILFLYRDSYYNQEAERDLLEINIAKHREGPTGEVKVYYNLATGRMGDWT